MIRMDGLIGPKWMDEKIKSALDFIIFMDDGV